LECDSILLEKARNDGFQDGSTALVVVIFNKVITIANAGDCRAVICQNNVAVDLSIDHKPNSPKELKRINSLGGSVRFWAKAWRITKQGAGLATSRSFGDLNFKQPIAVVTAEPEIKHWKLSNKDQFLIMASDGIWDVIDSQSACNIVLNHLKKKQNLGKNENKADTAAAEIIKKARILESDDDATVIVVYFEWPEID